LGSTFRVDDGQALVRNSMFGRAADAMFRNAQSLEGLGRRVLARA